LGHPALFVRRNASAIQTTMQHWRCDWVR